MLLSKLASWVQSHGWTFMLVPAVAYALWALSLKLTGKPWTAGAWIQYAGANLCFLVAHFRGE